MGQDEVLIIEDVYDIAQIIQTNIEDIGLKTRHAADGESGLKEAQKGRYSLIILDLMLPGIDGITICKRIREKDSGTPILILTAKDDEIDRILGLELGADDYMTKPFSVRELNARVKALLRRSRLNEQLSKMPENSKLSIGSIVIDAERHLVLVDNNEIDLTVKEFELLTLFVSNPGRVFSRSYLLDKIWGVQFEGYEHTVNTHINRLRNKIEKEPGNPEYLKTVWGVGYKFNEDI